MGAELSGPEGGSRSSGEPHPITRTHSPLPQFHPRKSRGRIVTGASFQLVMYTPRPPGLASR
eukprot:8822583-Pyramimonas_sp.AAC.1